MPPRRIFISAVSRELRSYRLLVEQSLQKRGYTPVFQDIFELTDQEIAQLLRDNLSPCEAVICLIGRAYGAEPSKPLDGHPRRSFTQLEYFFGRERGLPIFLFLTTDEIRPDNHCTETDDLRQLQRDYRNEVTRDRNWRSFANVDQLRAEIAELKFPWGADPLAHKPCNLPSSIGTLFKGRDEFLATLRRKLTAAVTKAAAITPRHAIHGLGGVGKTQLAVEYGWRHAGEYSALLYLYADSPGALLTNLALLTGVLELPERELKEDAARASAVLCWLNEHPGWLLLVDNVDSAEAARAVTDQLHALHGGHVIITSRIARWPALVEPLELDVLSVEDAGDYLLEAAHHRAGTPDDRGQARLIARDVDGLALALTQAAGYIDKYRIGFAEYRKRWQGHFAKVSGWHDERTMSYPRSLAVTWNTTVDQLTPPARALLELLSWLAPEPWPRDLITGETSSKPLAEAGISEPEEALMELADVSLARIEEGNGELHRLVQEITRGRIAVEQREPRLRSMLAVVDHYPLGDDPTDVRNWPVWDPLSIHVAVVVEHADGANIATPTSVLMNNLGLFLKQRIRFVEAERLYRRALAIDEQRLGTDHPTVAIELNNLAGLLEETNRLAEAEPLLRRALAIDEQSFGPDHPHVAICLNNLTSLLFSSNRLTEAEPLVRRALAIDEQSFGADHPQVATTLNNLASLLLVTNRLAEAEPLMRRALAIDEQSFGTDHPNVAIRLKNLATVLQVTNRLTEAEPLMRRALAIDAESFGTDHPEVAGDLNNLALLLYASNRLAEAEPLMRRALELTVDFARRTGFEHPKLRSRIGNYRQLLEAMGRSDAEIDAALAGLLHPQPPA